MSQEFEALVKTLSELPAVELRRICAMPPAFWQDFGRELTAAAMFGDPGHLRIDVHHRDNGVVQEALFTGERSRKYKVAKL